MTTTLLALAALFALYAAGLLNFAGSWAKPWAGVAFGPPGRRAGMMWSPGQRWRCGALSVFLSVDRESLVVGLGEQHDPSPTCRIIAARGPVSVAFYYGQVVNP